MRHQTLEHLQTLADVNLQLGIMTRLERLACWAELLEQDPERILRTFPGTEYECAETRGTMRVSDSPITVAFHDPSLHADGLNDDTYGEARRFFEITARQLHDIICGCHFGEMVKAGHAAQGVRLSMVIHSGLLDRLRKHFFDRTQQVTIT